MNEKYLDSSAKPFSLQWSFMSIMFSNCSSSLCRRPGGWKNVLMRFVLTRKRSFQFPSESEEQEIVKHRWTRFWSDFLVSSLSFVSCFFQLLTNKRYQPCGFPVCFSIDRFELLVFFSRSTKAVHISNEGIFWAKLFFPSSNVLGINSL